MGIFDWLFGEKKEKAQVNKKDDVVESVISDRLLGPPDVKKLKEKQDVDGLIEDLSQKYLSALNKYNQHGEFNSNWMLDKSIAKIGEPAFEPLLIALKAPEYWYRVVGALGLGMIKDERSVEPLIQALNDETDDVRAMAAMSLGVIRDERSVEPLAQVLKDEIPGVKTMAVLALKGIRGEKAKNILTKALQVEDDPEFRKMIIESLENI